MPSRSLDPPIPPPALLEGYERLVPGAADRILSMAETEAEHVRSLDRTALAESVAEIKRGQWFAFVVAMTALAASVAAAALGYPAVAGVVGGTTVVGLVTVFVVGRQARSNGPQD